MIKNSLETMLELSSWVPEGYQSLDESAPFSWEHQNNPHFIFISTWCGFVKNITQNAQSCTLLSVWWSRFNLDQFQELITSILGPTSLLVKFSSSCLLSNPAKKIGNKPITKTSRAEEKSGNRNLIYETEIILTIRFLFWLSTWQMQFRNK